jgi:hypothetical protein
LANSRADLQCDDDDSDTSSLLVFHALTKEMSQSDEFMHQHQHQQSYHSQKQQQQHHLSPADAKEIKLCSIAHKPATVPASKNDDPAMDFFDRMTGGNGKNVNRNDTRTEGGDVAAAVVEYGEHGELLIELIRAEEIFIAHIIVKCLKFCPSAFEGEITKAEIMKMIEKASRFLWTHISSTLGI